VKHTVLAMIFALALAPFASAHEGHDHKFMGTVSAIHDNALEVKGIDGKTSAISLTDKTRIVQGTTVMKTTDIKAGDRVVVTATGGGKAPFVAKEVRLGTAVQAPKAAPAKKRGDQ
jgi:hypothetical protein